MKQLKVMSVFGTRPEAIKMCPLILKMEQCSWIKSMVCVTAQHRQMLDQVLNIFGVEPDYDLDLMRERQTLTTITSSVITGMKEVFQKAQPDLVLVHGDTTTTFAVALAAFYEKIPVGHVEAGLRTYDRYSPFPEELNRQLTGRIAEMHFAPTKRNAENLKAEGIDNHIFITGNTVIDAFDTTVRQNYQFKEKKLDTVDFINHRVILLTAHRRENLGEPLERICRAVRHLVREFEDLEVVYPVHFNPAVRETVNAFLQKEERIHLLDPIDVEDMHNCMAKSYLVLTDSGGLQEEAPHFGVPVIVLRTETERPEAVEAGTALVAGTDEEEIYQTVTSLLKEQAQYGAMAHAVNPYGDGHAGEKIIEAIFSWNQERNV